MNPKPVLAVLLAVLLASSAAFAIDVGERRPDPVAFDDTVKMGMTAAATVEARESGREIPRAEAFYTRYRYAVGYHGVSSLVDELGRDGHDRQFGDSLAVYVTDYAAARLQVTDEGSLRVPDAPDAAVGWVAADEAYFAVGSDAETPAGDAVVPFSSRGAAESFVGAHGGEIRRWDAVRSMSFGTAVSTREAFRTAVREQRDWADRQVTEKRGRLDRPVSVVVGEDAATLSAAVAAAPPNTTVAVPPGTYETNVTVDKPLTLRGVGRATHLRGDGTGSPITVTAPRAAIADLRVSGVGDTNSRQNVSTNTTDEWDHRIQVGYGYGDAGVTLDGANGSLVSNVSIETPANGVVVRWSPESVVENVTVDGSETARDGFMGAMVMGSRVVVQNSTFVGGRDGVYTHRSDGLVVRNNRMVGEGGMRFGVHEMYTSDALVANNTVRATDEGIVVMTRPTGNLVVGNDVRDSAVGINVGGHTSYVAENVVADNRHGVKAPSETSLYERNLIAGNGVGFRAASIIPTNRVVANDFAANDRYVSASLGPLRVWTAEGRGNYWDGAPGTDADGDGTLDRAFQPSGPVDGRAERAPGATTLGRSPAVSALRALQGVAPGLRPTGVVDEAPLADPMRPDALAELNETGER